MTEPKRREFTPEEYNLIVDQVQSYLYEAMSRMHHVNNERFSNGEADASDVSPIIVGATVAMSRLLMIPGPEAMSDDQIAEYLIENMICYVREARSYEEQLAAGLMITQGEA